MKKLFAALICISILSPAGFARRQEPLANDRKSGLYARSIEQVLRLRENQVDLATAALIVSENWSDMVYGRRYLETLDDMAYEIRDRLRRRRIQADYRAIPVINNYLFKELGFKSVSEADDPHDLFLHTVLDKKAGYCLSLSILYLSLAERLGLPLYGVVVPGHFFVRYDDNQIRFNIETTSSGGSAGDEHYIDKFKVPGGNNGIYMKNLDKIQTLGCFFNNLGNSYNDVGNIDSAQLALETAVEINPMLSESRANLGNIYLAKGRVTDAINQYRQALRINPHDAKTHNNMGNAYVQKDWLNYAINEYHQSIRLEPEFTDAYKNLAIVYGKQERFQQAIMQLQRAIALKSDDAECYSQLGNVFQQMGKYSQAISQYKKATRIDATLAEAYYGLGVCHNKLNSVDDEIWAYKRALAVEPEMVAALVNLGNAYFSQKKYELAIEQYKKAATAEPAEGMIHYNLGAAYSNIEDYEKAVAAYLTAVETDPDNGDAHYGLAFGYYHLKKYRPAWKHIQTAEKLGVDVSKDLLKALKRKAR
jgi:tetratricopeptide (TPR) repeat protein